MNRFRRRTLLHLGTSGGDLCCVDFLDAPIKRVTCLDTPMAYAPTLVEAFLPNKDKLIEAVKEVTYSK